jgi:hypothetical protein
MDWMTTKEANSMTQAKAINPKPKAVLYRRWDTPTASLLRERLPQLGATPLVTPPIKRR